MNWNFCHTDMACELDGCVSRQHFWGYIDSGEFKALIPRILTAAGWLHLDKAWTCPDCSAMAMSNVGRMTTGQRLAVYHAIEYRERYGRIDVRGE